MQPSAICHSMKLDRAVSSIFRPSAEKGVTIAVMSPWSFRVILVCASVACLLCFTVAPLPASGGAHCHSTGHSQAHTITPMPVVEA